MKQTNVLSLCTSFPPTLPLERGGGGNGKILLLLKLKSATSLNKEKPPYLQRLTGFSFPRGSNPVLRVPKGPQPTWLSDRADWSWKPRSFDSKCPENRLEEGRPFCVSGGGQEGRKKPGWLEAGAPRALSASLGIPSRLSLSDSTCGFPASPPRAVSRTELRL